MRPGCILVTSGLVGPRRSIVSRLRQWRRGVSISDVLDDPQLLGLEGERVAARFLARNGYKVLYRNYRAPKGGEVDIVCRDRAESALVFVEVKTRRAGPHGTPAQAVTPAKQRLITRGALTWLRLLDNPEVRFRFDIVEVVVDGGGGVECSVIPNAFELPEPYIY